jgi:hypothetical protein
MRPVCINLTRLKVRDKDMPIVIAAVFIGTERDDSRRFCCVIVVELEQFNQGSSL